MIYYMDTKTLVKKFSNTFSPDIVLGSKYILFSARMIPSEKYSKLSYQQNVFFGLSEDLYKNIEIIKRSLSESPNDLNILCNIIEESLVFPNSITVILSTPNETKTKYPEYMAKSIEEMFKYPIIDFKHGLKEKYSYNPKVTCKRLKYFKALNNKIIFEDHPERIKEISKKARKETLKMLGGYQKGMTQEEIDAELIYSRKVDFR